MFLAIVSTSVGAAPDDMVAVLKSDHRILGMAGRMILVHVSAAKVALPVSVRATNTPKQRNLFMIKGSLFLSEGGGPVSVAVRQALKASEPRFAPLSIYLGLRDLPGLDQRLNAGRRQPGPAFFMHRFRALDCSP